MRSPTSKKLYKRQTNYEEMRPNGSSLVFVTGRRGPAKTRGPALIPRPAPLPSTRCPAPFERGRGADKRSRDLSEIAIHTPYYVIHTPRASFFYLAKVISSRIDAAHGPTPRRGPPLGQGDRAENRPR